MEVIRNYLESMFANMPNTEQVQRAKRELLQMMEDKYNELISEGKNENEAVGTVISQFGNLEELAGELGIDNPKEGQNDNSRCQVTIADARGYLTDAGQAAFLTALGVFLCITCTIGCIFAAMTGFKSNKMDMMMAGGVIMLFVFIAVAVGLFIFSGMKMNRWNYLKKVPCSIDYSTAEFLNGQYESYRMTNALMITFGVILIIVSVVPISVIGITGFGDNGFAGGIGIVILLIFVGLGVMMLIITGSKSDSYKVLLSLNDKNTVSGSYWDDDRCTYKNKTIETVMSIYNETVVCLYLIWSFITFDWHITWIIFPISVVIKKLINGIFSDNHNTGEGN